MASRRRRSRRGWSWPRLHRRLIHHRTSAVRAAFGAALLLGVWLLWPEPDHGGGSQWQSLDQQTVTGAARGDRPVAAAPASIAVSAKRQLSGEAVARHDRIERTLPQVADTMPEIGIPDPSALGRTATTGMAPAAEAVPGDVAAAAPEPSDQAEAAPSAGAAPSVTAAALDLVPDTALIARAEAAIEPAAPPLAAPGSADDDFDGTVVARLDAPAAMMPPETGGHRTPTWLRNAVAPANDHRPAIALVIDDLGLNRRAAAALNRLRGPLTLAFLPYATKLDEQTRAARAAGHELLVHVPMEPRGPEWPGPNALTSQLEPVELVARLRSHLRSFRGFVGINNHMGSLLTTDPERMAILMAELRQRGLLFLDSRTTPESIAAREAERLGVPHAERDVFIDNDLDLEAVLQELARAERIARYHGHAVAIGHPHDETIEALNIWLPMLEARDIALVPISTIVARRSCASGILLVADACARYAVAATVVQ